MTTDALLFVPQHESHIIVYDEATVACCSLPARVVYIIITTAACFAQPHHEYAACRRLVILRRLLTPRV